MALSKLINRWSETITIQIASEANKYNQCTYTNSTIQGCLIQATELVQVNEKGEKIISNAKLFTTTKLKINDKVGNFVIMHEKTCKDKNNAVQFYKYYLSKESKTV
jgi:hypothetical protein